MTRSNGITRRQSAVLISLVLATMGACARPGPELPAATTTAIRTPASPPASSVVVLGGAETGATPDARLLERVVVLGSSASGGFLTPAALNVLVDPMITTEHEPVLSAASWSFFSAPEEIGERLAAQAADHDPTLVIALDYLFWYGYGELPSETARLVLLEQGLENLERFDCPVIVSPYPVVTQAIGKIIRPSQVPARRTLERLDSRVREWADENPNVHIVSVPRIYAQLMAQPPEPIAGQTWPREAGVSLMQHDCLHPTVEGLTAVSALILQDLVRQGLIPADSVDLDLRACLAKASGEVPDAPAGAPTSPVPASPRAPR